MADIVKRVRRKESFSLALILTMGLSVLITNQSGHFFWQILLLLVLQIGGSLWALGIGWKIEKKHLETYALLILPVILYAGFIFFLLPIRTEPIAWFGVVANFPLMYLLYISLSALQQYRILPNHVARVILNVMTLLAGYVAYTFVFQSQVAIGIGMLFVFVLSELILYQGIFWWSNRNLGYTFFYSTLSSFILSIFYFVLYFWPFGYLVTGFTLMIGQYVLMGIIQQYFKKQLTVSVVAENILIGLVCVFMILLQVQWIPEV